jgi:dTDP-4-dehydrorhamnose reductase
VGGDLSPSPLYVATGPYGLVGRGLLKVFPDLVPVDLNPAPDFAPRPSLALPPVDITVPAQVFEAFERVKVHAKHRPVIVFHLAALTDTKSEDKELFQRVNVRGTENALTAAKAIQACFIHISTDYVFSAEDRAGEPYTERDRPAKPPSSAYAASKFHAENLVLDTGDPERSAVVRIAFPYGSQGPRPGLAEKILLRFQESQRNLQPVRLFNDQYICPSYVPDVAEGLRRLAQRFLGEGLSAQRIYHLTGPKTTPLQFGEWLRKIFHHEKVPLEPASLQGTSYVQNLWLAHDATAQALKWRPQTHEAALRAMQGP